ncbi:hypothetical protein [uncultured Dubosiella sp.]|uniref:hypothetical protein n=1 Tax=uncultured Dubosiella sp. TaxID=1937011 RepID=UPI0025B49EC7|nr:hypothetical protein [uncultured Dubosiella sp.]
MNEKFQCEYEISRRWAEAMFWRRVPVQTVFASALFPLVLFGLAWYVKATWLKILCLLCGLGLVIWNVVAIGRQAAKEIQGSGHVEVTIENDEVRSVLTLENQPEKRVTQPLSRFGAFRQNGKWLLLEGTDQPGDLYVCGSASELHKLAALLRKRGLMERSGWMDTLGKGLALVLLAAGFAMAVSTFFPDRSGAGALMAWEKQGGYTVYTRWTQTDVDNRDAQTASVWTDGDRLYRVERLEKDGETTQIELSRFFQDEEKVIRLDAKGKVKLIEETEISKTDFFFAPVFQTCWDLLEEDWRGTPELSPAFSWRAEGDQTVGELRDPGHWTQRRLRREKAAYTQSQLNAMSLTERMERFSTSQFVPVRVTYTLDAQEGLMRSIAFDALINGKQGKTQERGTIDFEPLALPEDVKEEVEAVFEQDVRHGDSMPAFS